MTTPTTEALVNLCMGFVLSGVGLGALIGGAYAIITNFIKLCW